MSAPIRVRDEPNGLLAAPVGATCVQVLPGGGTRTWIKQDGSDDVGWVAAEPCCVRGLPGAACDFPACWEA